jgi:YD repeat-containing protein
MSYTGFVYDSERRVRQAASLDGGGQNYLFDFTDGLPTGTTAPGGPAPGTWKTTTGADEFGRPTHVWRHLTASSKQTYTFAYDNSFAPRPTTLTRGVDGSSGAVSTFVYDDFGRLVQSVTPEHGTTRYEYDLADNLIKERVGVGTALVRTSVRSYDSLGRLTFVDHDTEHSVNCSSGTAKIQDEEYKYDGCAGDAPAGVVCGYALGRLAIARTHLHCSGGATVKRGRWYNYDAQGRVASIVFGSQTTTGATSTYGTPLYLHYSYTAAGRVRSAGSPLNWGFGTSYFSASVPLSPSTGLPQVMETYGGSALVSGLTYQAFGGVRKFTTPVTVPTVNRTLKFRASYRGDGALRGLRWKLDGATDVFDLYQNFTFTPAGLLATRTETQLADKTTSRHYGYDSLLRLTCEARGSGVTQPSAADCNASSTRLAGLFTFHNGANSTQPPDVRNVAHIKRPGYNTLAGGDQSSYSGGSGKVVSFTRGAGNSMTLGYDVVGRRSFEYDSIDPVRSRRDYTYLPNGQLGTITGKTPTSAAYTTSVNYDHEGRPLTMTVQTGTAPAVSYEFYWDDQSRLISVRIDDNNPVASARLVWTWHYHYLGDQVVAATREKKTGTATPVVQRYWAEFDERGLIYNMVTNQGVKDFAARYDASGWRQVVTQVGGGDMYMPFGLPGQLYLERVATNGATAGVDSHRGLRLRLRRDPHPPAPDAESVARLRPAAGRVSAAGWPRIAGRGWGRRVCLRAQRAVAMQDAMGNNSVDLRKRY